MNDYFTIDLLGTSAGMIAAVTVIVQFLKLPMDRVLKVPTRFVVLGIAFVLQIVYQCAVIRDYSFNAFFLSFINSIVVALGSMGAYDLTFAEIDKLEAACKDRIEQLEKKSNIESARDMDSGEEIKSELQDNLQNSDNKLGNGQDNREDENKN